MSDIPLGRFCWYELMVPAPEQAPSFYSPITGWGTAPFEAGDKPYTMWVNGEQPVGGMMELPAEAVAQGAPPHWMGHISTPNVEATVRRATELGGQVLMGPVAIPTVGEFAVMKDPQGAVFSAYQPEGKAPGHDAVAELGEFSWHELMTTDWEAAWEFYSELFGWEKGEAMDMGDMGVYQMFNRGAHPLGGMFNKPPEVPASFWMFYVRVPDADAAAAQVEEMGGRILSGPMDVPGGGRIAQCMDTQGAAFAVHSDTAEG